MKNVFLLNRTGLNFVPPYFSSMRCQKLNHVISNSSSSSSSCCCGSHINITIYVNLTETTIRREDEQCQFEEKETDKKKNPISNLLIYIYKL